MAQWAGEAGYAKMSALLGREMRLEIAEELSDWTKTQKKAVSKALFRCTTCNVVAGAIVNNVARGQHISCRCNSRAISWPSKLGYDTFQECIQSQYQLTTLLSWDAWKCAVKGKKTKVELRCLHCGHTAFAAIQGIVLEHKFQCRCTGFVWNSAGGFEQMLRHIESADRFEFADCQPTCLDWLSDSPIRIQCRLCSAESFITASTFRRTVNSGLKCVCNHRGEKDVYCMLERLTNSKDLCVRIHPRYDGLLGQGGGPLFSDFAVVRGKEEILFHVEIDGGYHFGLSSTNPRAEQSRITMRHDLIKETSSLVPIVRICTDSVKGQPSKVATMLAECLDSAERGSLSGVHRWSVRGLYEKSAYAALRSTN